MKRFYLFCLFAQPLSAAAGELPNLVVILADDLGYGDVGAYGSKQISTPHIDELAASGVKFTNGYVCSPVCAPSRAGLLTGKHPLSFGFSDNLTPPQPGHDPAFVGLPLSQKTIADRLKPLGYTNGIIGKWHLGELPQFSPLKRGFDEFWGYLGGGHDYFRADPEGDAMATPILCNFKTPEPLTYLTDDTGNECAHFIRRHKAAPFFLFAAFAAPHSPMQATKEDLDAFSHITDRRRRTYCAMIRSLDRNVGKIVGEIRSQGLNRKTLVVFLSDNGGQCAPRMESGASNAPLRGGKTMVLEGGIRVPMILSWPGKIPAGNTVDGISWALDIAPTLLGAAGGKSDGMAGINLLPHVSENPSAFPERTMMWRYTVGSAIRTGSWKLVRLPDRLPMLFDLSTDPAELKDLATTHKERTQELLEKLGRWEVLSPNPLFREPADWRVRHLGFYDATYPLQQPE